MMVKWSQFDEPQMEIWTSIDRSSTNKQSGGLEHQMMGMTKSKGTDRTTGIHGDKPLVGWYVRVPKVKHFLLTSEIRSVRLMDLFDCVPIKESGFLSLTAKLSTSWLNAWHLLSLSNHNPTVHLQGLVDGSSPGPFWSMFCPATLLATQRSESLCFASKKPTNFYRWSYPRTVRAQNW